MSRIALSIMILFLFSGCAGLTMTGTGFNLGDIAPAKNSQVATTTAEVKDAWGQNSRVTDTWQVQNGTWVLVSSHQASGAGVGQTSFTAAAGGAPMAITLPIAARALRPDNTSVSQTNQGGNASQSQSGINTQAQGQLQGQAQGQLQGQAQGQINRRGAIEPRP